MIAILPFGVALGHLVVVVAGLGLGVTPGARLLLV